MTREKIKKLEKIIGKWECARYYERLNDDFDSEYTKLQVTLEDGKVFADA